MIMTALTEDAEKKDSTAADETSEFFLIMHPDRTTDRELSHGCRCCALKSENRQEAHRKAQGQQKGRYCFQEGQGEQELATEEKGQGGFQVRIGHW